VLSPSVPYNPLGQQAAEIKQELLGAFEAVLDRGRFVLGPELAAFEGEFARLCQVPLAVGVSSGTCALHLALRALGVGAGDEVITVPNSFVATAAAVALVGGRPVFADIGPDLNLDPDRLEAAITPRTRGIIPVHLTGRPCHMTEILDVARRRGLFVLEDAAQAVGARLHGRPVGSWGDAACFSLHPLKNLYAFGDGGMITTADPALAQRLGLARNHGLRDRETCEFFSYNCRLDELQAALLRVNLRHLERRTEARRRLAHRYNDLLRPFVEVPEEGPGEYCVYQTYVIRTDKRDALKRHLNDNGVEALIHYPRPIHLQPAAAYLNCPAGQCPRAEREAGRILSLPLFPGMTAEQQDRVVGLIADFCRGRGAKAVA
jgi:dTDP-4-amino-4,6-dideoxygalactose transaminase